MSRSRPASVMDAPPSPQELRHEQERMQQDHDERAVHEAALAGTKGEGFPDDPFFGTSPDDAKARRHARGAYAQEDIYTEPDPIDNYAGPRSRDQVYDMNDLSSYVGYKMALTREKYSDFDSVIHEHVIPALQEAGLDENDPKVQQFLLQDGCMEAAYHYGLGLKYQNKLPKDWEKMDGDTFGEWLSSNHGSGPRASEDDPPRPDNNRREMRRLNKIEDPEAFARALDDLKRRW